MYTIYKIKVAVPNRRQPSGLFSKFPQVSPYIYIYIYIYNGNETAVHYKMLQDTTLAMLALKHDKNKRNGFKQSKDRVTLFLCTNQKGNHKLFSLQKQLHKQIHFHGRLFVHMRI